MNKELAKDIEAQTKAVSSKPRGRGRGRGTRGRGRGRGQLEKN